MFFYGTASVCHGTGFPQLLCQLAIGIHILSEIQWLTFGKIQIHARGRMMAEMGDGKNLHLIEDLDQECTIWGIGMPILCKTTVQS